MNQEELLRESIIDTQLTVRAIDVKAGFFLVFLCLPLSQMDKITAGLHKLSLKSKHVFFSELV